MDCIDAQRVISETLDKEAASPESMALARQHCKSCSQCADFVRALVRVQGYAPPQPPADLTDRVMATVRAQATRNAAAPTDTTEQPRPASIPSAQPAGALERLIAFLTAPRNRRAVAIWSTAAVALFVVATITAVDGIKQITSDTVVTRQSEQAATDSMSALSAAPESPVPDTGYAETAPQPASAAPNYTVVNGIVYLATGPASGVDVTTLKPVGTAQSSLDVGGVSTSRQVLGLNDLARVYIVDSEGVLLGFDRVTRQYDGKAFALASGELPAYGIWPTLPAGVSQPSNPSGVPEYVSVGTDAAGVEVFKQVAGDVSSGIAVAPGTPPSDPAAANPGWTWWVPVK
jgi:hypothetical protein